MKKLAIILALILAALLAVCFFLREEPVQETTQPTVPTAPTVTETTAPTQSLPTQPSDTESTQPSQTLPSEPETIEPNDDEFVLIADWIPDVRVELAYATQENFTGTKIYDFTDAYLRYGTVKKLANAAELLRGFGYGIVIWDGYRPVYAQEKLWDVCPDPTYVSPPGTGTQSHCRGIAVDVTLYDLQTGEIIEMPSGFDEFSPLGDRDYSDCTTQVRENALILENIMINCGFKAYSGEWWHFSDTDSYEIEYVFDPAAGAGHEEQPIDALDTVLGSVWYATCKESMILRADSNFDAPSLATIYPGEAMTLAAWDGVFAKVVYKGIEGYVLTNYIRPENSLFENILDTVEWDPCYTYDEMVSDLQSFEQTYSQIMELDTLGQSEWGTVIPVIRVGDANAEHHVLFHASLHAREHVTTWLVMPMLDYWIDTGAGDCDDVCVHIIPMVNPDGVETAQTETLNEEQKQIYQADLNAGYTQLSEKEYARMWKANGVGVDLNRNFDALWNMNNDRSGPSSALFRGTEPFSAKESAALRDYTLKYDFGATISYHTAGSVIYYDFGDNFSANEASKELALTIEEEAGYPLLTSTGVDSGGYKDWAIEALGIPSVTLEVGVTQPVDAEKEKWALFARNCEIIALVTSWVRAQ